MLAKAEVFLLLMFNVGEQEATVRAGRCANAFLPENLDTYNTCKKNKNWTLNRSHLDILHMWTFLLDTMGWIQR